MKKILPVIAIAALASSGAVLAQTTTTLSDGTVVQTTPEPAYVTPAQDFGRPAPILINPTLPPNQQAVIVAAAPVPGQVVAYIEPEVVLVGNHSGPIKLGGPKYDPLGRKIYSPREVR